VDSAVDRLLSLARSQPERPLLLTRGRSYSYGSFARRAAALAADLSAAGVNRGDRVATLLEEYDNFFVAMFGVWLAGAVVVPLNTSLPQHDIDWLVAKAQPHLLLTENGTTGAGEAVRCVSVAAADLAERPIPGQLVPVGRDDLAMIMFTSGTTGVPKGVCQTLRAIGGNAARVADVLGLAADDRIFINTPPYFTSGICHFLTLMANGGSTSGRLGFFFGDGLLTEMAELGCTGFGGAPAHLVRVVEPLGDEARPSSSLRFWVSSGDHLATDTIERMQRVLPGVRLFNMYGLTEVCGRLCILPPDELDRRRGSVGRPIAGMTVTVRAPDGAPAPDGQSGELYVDGPLVMQGYLNEPEITAASLTELGFRTGDFGRRDAAGFVWIEGRKDDIIKRGGEKVSIVHIQEALRSLGAFADVAVVAVDDEILGHVPVAFVVPADPATFKRTAVMRELRAVLPATSMPSRIVPLDEIPRTGSGKAIRADLLRLSGERRS
jgi:acyl-CoA synthetase (AMP-forming)/AMP-acid ligase II